MTHTKPAWTLKAFLLIALVAIPLSAGEVVAQEYAGPLTVEGLHQHNNPSAASRAFGGVTIGSNDIGLMFRNPASMQSLDGIRISLSGVRQYRDWDQEQHFAPVRYYPNLSLLLEGMTDRIPDPDPNLIGFTPADSVQRPYDDVPPSWSRSNTTDRPLHALLAVPFSLGGVTITAGLGAVQYANLNYYAQNNNVLDPAVLAQRPLPTPRPTDDNPVTVDWYQSMHSRDGSIYGYGLALAGHIEQYNLTIGISGLLLNGESDDVEQLVQRGRLTFLANEFRAEPNPGHAIRSGTSEFSGQEFTISGTWSGQYASLGVVVRPPTTYTRTYDMSVEGDIGELLPSTLSGEDEFQLPWRGSVGLLLNPHEGLNIGLEYELRPYDSATFTSAASEETSPWHSASLFRIGASYELFPWLALRGGLRGEADVFVPEGSAIVDDPVSYRMFSGGLGFTFAGVRWNVTYERTNMTYEDIWGSAVSRNSDSRHAIVTDVSFTIPTRR